MGDYLSYLHPPPSSSLVIIISKFSVSSKLRRSFKKESKTIHCFGIYTDTIYKGGRKADYSLMKCCILSILFCNYLSKELKCFGAGKYSPI